MEKRVVSGIELTLLFTSFLTMVFSSVPAIFIVSADTQLSLPVRNTDTGLDYLTIQEAINAPETLDGHTIFVEEGTYYEHVTVNKSLVLLGENRETTIIDGSGIGHVVNITSDNVDMKGFTVQNSSAAYFMTGINLNNVNHCNISGNIMTNNGHGIYLHTFSYYNTISGNNITANHKWGLDIIDSHYNNVSGNTIGKSLGSVGIHGYSTNNLVFENNITDNVNYGIIIDGSRRNSIFRNNIANHTYGISVQYDSWANNVFENVIADNDIGVWVKEYSWFNRFYHNNFKDNTQQVIITRTHPSDWDDGYPSGGNYWSDYTGVDEFSGPNQDEPNSDGIGDTPYLIDAYNRDRYPLTEPWAEPAMIKFLIRTIWFWNLPRGTENSLTSKLEEVLHLLDIGNENGAIHKLMDFINQVEALRDKKLTTQQAEQLTSEAQGIIDLIKEETT